MTKACFKCGQVKPLSGFYRHFQMSDGHLNKCKECTKRDSRNTRSAKIEYYRAYDRARSDQPHRIAIRKRVAVDRKNNHETRAIDAARTAEWNERNSEKRAAHVKVGNAIRDGKLKPQPCERCSQAVGVQAHHEDYSKPLDVIWLCPPCHGQRHREINEERRKAS